MPAHHCLEAALADPAVEAVALFTPPIVRAKLIVRILAAGHHVITTKPFEMDLGAQAPSGRTNRHARGGTGTARISRADSPGTSFRS